MSTGTAPPVTEPRDQGDERITGSSGRRMLPVGAVAAPLGPAVGGAAPRLGQDPDDKGELAAA